MNMKTIHNIFGWTVGVAIGLSGCATDADIELPVPGNVPVALSGVMTRGTETNDYPNLHLIAKVDVDGKEDVYIPETSITCAGLETTNPKDITIGTVFYPIGDTEIRFFAYSGTATAGKMALTAGTERANDAILSNYGSQKTVSDISTEGKGTPGTSKAPAEVLQFRHVMTQLNVSVVVDNAESPAVDPVPTSIKLELAGAVQKGTYPITAVTPTGAIDDEATAVGTDLYLIKKGTNYLVPTGAVLSGKGLFKKLEIDDYAATESDLAGFEIGYVSEGSNATSGALKLLPGYSYKLEFKVKRLKVTGITLKKVDWLATEIKDNDVSYTPQELTLNLGAYSAIANEDTITKVVLYEKGATDKAKQYVGDYLHSKHIAKFVTLPSATAAVDSVELYTSKGLLIHGAKPTGYADNGTNGKKLTLPLSVGGMLPENPSAAASESNPYLIKTALQFLNVSKDLKVHYKQAVSVDMERLNNTEITPLGAMTGSYDGNGFQILHLNLKGAGLFTSNSGVLKNIRIVSGTVNGSGAGSVGGICGSNTGTIVACTNQARIINAPTHAGGICGSNSGSITACLNTGNIPSGTTVGGICGANTNTAAGAITACVNTGMLNTTATSLAGICGTAPNNSDTSVLKVCYWLTGTAEKNQGDTAAGSGGNDWNNNGGRNNEVGVNGVTPDNAADVADLSPQKLRNQMTAEETINTTTRLNNTIATTSYNNTYHFVLDAKTTGCTWPIPVIKKP